MYIKNNDFMRKADVDEQSTDISIRHGYTGNVCRLNAGTLRGNPRKRNIF
jgi:hypothetical protein